MTYNLGQVSIVPRGAWSSSTQYSRLDAVTYAGGTWLCTAAHKGVDPAADPARADYWQLLANGVASAALDTPADDAVTLTLTLTDGTTVAKVLDTAAIPDASLDLAAKAKAPLPVATGGTGSTTAPAARRALEAQQQFRTLSLTLAAGQTSWTAAASGLGAEDAVLCAPAPASYDAYYDAEIRCTAQAAGSLTFAAAAAPSAAVTVQVLILPAEASA